MCPVLCRHMWSQMFLQDHLSASKLIRTMLYCWVSGSNPQKFYNVTEMLYGCSRKKTKQNTEAMLGTKLNPPK